MDGKAGFRAGLGILKQEMTAFCLSLQHNQEKPLSFAVEHNGFTTSFSRVYGRYWVSGHRVLQLSGDHPDHQG
jgi:hypothetical protein